MTEAPKPIFQRPLPPPPSAQPQEFKPTIERATPEQPPEIIPPVDKLTMLKERILDKADQLDPKIFLGILAGIFVLGLFFGAMLFGGGGETVVQGLVGVVENPAGDIARKRRCGVAERGQGCVLYLMNSSRVEKTGKEFFKEAGRVMGIPEYEIDVNNIKYAPMMIRPGAIAQINIPAPK